MSSQKGKPFASLLDAISDQIKTRVIFQSEHDANAITLWIAGTYLMDSWSLYPKLMLNSPERECGKTTALQVIEAFVCNGKIASSTTPSAVYRLIQSQALTLLIDEADRSLPHNEELNAVINAGHTRRTATKILSQKTSDGNWEPKELSLWCPQVIAGIGEFEDTLTSRSIVIGLRRKTNQETVKHLSIGFFEEHGTDRDSLSSWSKGITRDDLQLEPDMPVEAHNRERDNWLPLFQIAQIASSQWSDSAAAAFRAIELERSANVPVASGTELLMDIRQSLIDFIDVEIRASDLLIRLINMQDSDWQQFNYGKPITHKKLNKMLRPYGIQPKKRREANVFLLDNLQDAFNRYLPPLS